MKRRDCLLVGLSASVSACASVATSAPPGGPPAPAATAPAQTPDAAGEAAPSTPQGAPASTCSPVAIPPEPPGLPVIVSPVPADPVPITNAAAMKGFYEAFDRLLRGKATDSVRIAVFGDSNLTMDYQTGRLRRRMQRWFGDAGHGFVALSKPWSHYLHMDVEANVNAGWTSYAITTKPTNDSHYGLAGIVAENDQNGAKAWAKTAKEGSLVGTTCSRFDVYYVSRPKSGALRFEVDGKPMGRVETAADEVRIGMHRIEVEDGPHRLDVIADGGRIRLLGVALERKKPGVVIDSFGVGSMNTKSLGRNHPAVFEGMLAKRRYDMVVFLLGANDLFTMEAVPEVMHKVLGWCRSANPRSANMIVTPPDRGKAKPLKRTQDVVVQRRELAKAEDCALWDQFVAMGGAGSMAKWVQEKYAIFDAIHFNEKGAAVVADMLLEALLKGFDQYQKENLVCPS